MALLCGMMKLKRQLQYCQTLSTRSGKDVDTGCMRLIPNVSRKE